MPRHNFLPYMDLLKISANEIRFFISNGHVTGSSDPPIRIIIIIYNYESFVFDIVCGTNLPYLRLFCFSRDKFCLFPIFSKLLVLIKLGPLLIIFQKDFNYPLLLRSNPPSPSPHTPVYLFSEQNSLFMSFILLDV